MLDLLTLMTRENLNRVLITELAACGFAERGKMLFCKDLPESAKRIWLAP